MARQRQSSGAYATVSPRGSSAKQSQSTGGLESVCRFEPRLKFLLEDFCQNRLSETDVPFFEGMRLGSGIVPAADRDRREQASKSKSKALRVRPRVVVFVVGGLTYSETRVVHQVAAKYDVDLYAGADGLVSPCAFFKGVQDAHESG